MIEHVPAALVPWVNIGGIADGVVAEIVQQFVRDVLAANASDNLEYLSDSVPWIETSDIRTDGSFIWGELTGCSSPGSSDTYCTLSEIRDAVYFGPITALSLVLLMLALMSRSLMSMLGVGSRRDVFRTRRRMPAGFTFIVMWYPAAIAFLGLSNALASGLTTGGAVVPSGLTGAVGFGGSDISFYDYLITSLSGVLAGTLKFLFQVRIIMVLTLLYGGPIFIAMRYSGIKSLESLASNLLQRFVGFVLLPVGLALVMAIYGLVFMEDASTPTTIGGALSEQILLLGFEVAVLYICWRMLTFSTPLSGSISGTVSTAYQRVASGGREEQTGHAVADRIQRTGASQGSAPAGTARTDVHEFRRTENDPQR